MNFFKTSTPTSNFIMETNHYSPSKYVPQAVCEMYTRGKLLQYVDRRVHIYNVLLYLRKYVLRGALANGHDWIFLLIKIKDNFEGASFKQSGIISFFISETFARDFWAMA